MRVCAVFSLDDDDWPEEVPSSRMAWMTGTTRENSSSGETYSAPGRVEYPPMSIMFAPDATAAAA